MRLVVHCGMRNGSCSMSEPEVLGMEEQEKDILVGETLSANTGQGFHHHRVCALVAGATAARANAQQNNQQIRSTDRQSHQPSSSTIVGLHDYLSFRLGSPPERAITSSRR